LGPFGHQPRPVGAGIGRIAIDVLVVVGGLANHSGPLQLRADIRPAATGRRQCRSVEHRRGDDHRNCRRSLADAGEATAAMARSADVIRPDPRRTRTYGEKFA
jgi:hypothetical protein